MAVDATNKYTQLRRALRALLIAESDITTNLANGAFGIVYALPSTAAQFPVLSFWVNSAKRCMKAAARRAFSSSLGGGVLGGSPRRSTESSLGASRAQSSMTSRM